MNLRVSLIRPISNDAVCAVGVVVEFVVAQLTPHVQEDEGSGRNPHRQTQNVEEGVAFVTQQVPQGNSEIVLDHGPSGQVNTAVCLHCMLLYI